MNNNKNTATLAAQHILPKNWRWVKLGEVCEKPQYGYTASAGRNVVGPKFLRITDIQNGELNWSIQKREVLPRDRTLRMTSHRDSI